MNDSATAWWASGGTLLIGAGPDAWVAQLGSPELAQRLGGTHNSDVADLQLRIVRLERSIAALRIAAIDLTNQLAVLRYPDESTLWRLGGAGLERDYQALKAALDEARKESTHGT